MARAVPIEEVAVKPKQLQEACKQVRRKADELVEATKALEREAEAYSRRRATVTAKSHAGGRG